MVVAAPAGRAGRAPPPPHASAASSENTTGEHRCRRAEGVPTERNPITHHTRRSRWTGREPVGSGGCSSDDKPPVKALAKERVLSIALRVYYSKLLDDYLSSSSQENRR